MEKMVINYYEKEHMRISFQLFMSIFYDKETRSPCQATDKQVYLKTLNTNANLNEKIEIYNKKYTMKNLEGNKISCTNSFDVDYHATDLVIVAWEFELMMFTF